MRTRDREDQPTLSELTLPESLLKPGGELDPVRVTALRELAQVAWAIVHRAVQWEYKFAAPKRATWMGDGPNSAEQEFSQLGAEGWELVGFLEHGTAVFKRVGLPRQAPPASHNRS